ISAAQAAGALPAFEIPNIKIDRPKNPGQGYYASAVAMQGQKLAGKPPIEIAKTIQAHLPQADFIASAEVAPPGFLNFRLSEAWLTAQIENIISAGDRAFQESTGAGKTAQVEYVSANPTGPL